MDEELIMIKRLDGLREKHRTIDEQLKALDPNLDAFSMMRMKKEKLAIRDEIMRLERVVYPDIIA